MRKRDDKGGIQQPLAATLEMEAVFLYPNYRQSFNSFRLAALARSIRERGLIKPVIVNREDDGRCGVVAGQRRFLAHKMISAPSIKCMIYQGLTPDQIIKIQLAENSQEKIAPDELAESYWQMYLGALSKSTGAPISELDALADYWSMDDELKKQYSMTRFCRDIGKARSQIRRAFLYQRLHQHYKNLLAEGKIKYTSAVEVARIPNKNDQIAFTELVKRNSVAVGLRVNQYLLDKEGFVLMAQTNGGNGNSQDAHAARDIDRITGFFGSYVAMCGEVDWLYKDLSGDHNVQQSLEKILDASAKLDERLGDVPHYQEAISAPRKKSLRELILGNELHTVLKQYGEAEGHKPRKKKKVFEVKRLPIVKIVEDDRQPRRRYGQKNLENMAESVKALGVLQPILVRPVGKGRNMKYMIVTGHRRTRASRKADLKDMPAIIAYGLSDADARILQHEEDIFEEVALGERASGIYNMKRLKEQDLRKSLSIPEFAAMMPGFGVEEVSRALRFHALDERIKILEMKGLLRYSVCVSLAGVDDPEERYIWAIRAVLGNWKVSEADKRLREAKSDREKYPVESYSAEAQEFFKMVNDVTPGLRQMLSRDMEEQLFVYAQYLKTLLKKGESLASSRKLIEAYVNSKKAFDEFAEMTHARKAAAKASHGQDQKSLF